MNTIFDVTMEAVPQQIFKKCIQSEGAVTQLYIRIENWGGGGVGGGREG